MNKRHCQHPICFSWDEKEYVNCLDILRRQKSAKPQKFKLVRDEIHHPEFMLHITCDLLHKVYHVGAKTYDKIESIKAKIEKLEGIPAVLQHLFYNNVGLGDNDVVENCGITNTSSLSLGIKLHTAYCAKCKATHQYSVKMNPVPANLQLNTLTGDVYNVLVPLSNPVEDLKYLIQENYNLYPDNLLLLFDGVKLDEDVCLMEYGIQNNSPLLVVQFEYDNCTYCSGCAKAQGKPVIIVEFLNTSVIWALNPEFTVRKLKETMYEYLRHIHPDLQQMFLKNRELKDDRTLKYYGVTNGNTLNVRLTFYNKRCDECKSLLIKTTK